MDRHRINTSRIGEALAHARPAGPPTSTSTPGARRGCRARLRAASVLVPLVERGAGLSLILTRRAALLKHHPGQVAFPGGKQDPADADPARRGAARGAGGDRPRARRRRDPRRARPARDRHRLHGRAVRRPGRPGFRPVIDRAEVDEVFEVPLDFALDPANFQVHAPGRGRAVAALLRDPLRPALHLGRDRADAADARRPDARAVTRVDGAWLAPRRGPQAVCAALTGGGLPARSSSAAASATRCSAARSPTSTSPPTRARTR